MSIDQFFSVAQVVAPIFAAIFLGVLNNGMSMYGLSTDFQKVVKGAVLLLAVVMDVLTKKKKG